MLHLQVSQETFFHCHYRCYVWSLIWFFQIIPESLLVVVYLCQTPQTFIVSFNISQQTFIGAEECMCSMKFLQFETLPNQKLAQKNYEWKYLKNIMESMIVGVRTGLIGVFMRKWNCAMGEILKGGNRQKKRLSKEPWGAQEYISTSNNRAAAFLHSFAAFLHAEQSEQASKSIIDCVHDL